MDENQKIIYDLLTEVRQDQKKDSVSIAETKACVKHVQSKLDEVEKHVDRNSKNLAKNTEDVAEHISRTELAERSIKALTDLHQDNQKRIQNLEEDSKKKDKALEELGFDKKARHWLKENLKYWLAIAVLVAGLISKIAGLW